MQLNTYKLTYLLSNKCHYLSREPRLKKRRRLHNNTRRCICRRHCEARRCDVVRLKTLAQLKAEIYAYLCLAAGCECSNMLARQAEFRVRPILLRYFYKRAETVMYVCGVRERVRACRKLTVALPRW